MTHPAPLLQRLQSHQGKTRRMLTPGKKDSAGQHNPAASGLNAWGTQKYSQINQNMRFLRGERLGNFSPEKINLIGREIPAKFSNPASLLHIKPSPTEKDSIWSEVEQVLPAGEPAAPEARTQNEADVMRQGTVIQRLPTVPKPGQSIESFKEQIQSRKPTAKPAAPARIPPKSNDPAVRRYARIEEISQKPATTPEADLPQPGSLPKPESGQSDSQDTIQRQPEPTADTPPPTRPAKPPAPISEPRQTPPAQSDEGQDAISPAPIQPETPPVSTPGQPSNTETPELPLAPAAKPSSVDTTQPPTPRQPDDLPVLPFLQKDTHKQALAPGPKLPLREKPLPRARRNQPETKTPARDLPKAKPTPAPRLQTTEKTAASHAKARIAQTATPKTSGLIAPTIQRQPDSKPVSRRPTARPSAAPSTPPPRFESAASDSPSIQKSEPVLEASEKTDKPAASPKIEMPIIAYRREAPQQVRFLESQTMKAELQTPTIFKPSRPLLQRAPDTVSSEAKPVPPQAHTSKHLPVTKTQTAFQPDNAQTSASPTIPMPVAHLLQKTAAIPVHAAQAQQPVFSPPAAELSSQTPDLLAEAPASIKTSTQNVVQRLWDEHSPPASAPGQGSNSGQSDESSQASSGLDLDKIAEEVLPIVKRLIEIESERSAGYLR